MTNIGHFRAASKLLEGKQAEIEDFTYTVAHDLKAPVSAIGMTADGLLDGALADSARPEVSLILRLAGETEDMIVDLLRMVRIVSMNSECGPLKE